MTGLKIHIIVELIVLKYGMLKIELMIIVVVVMAIKFLTQQK